VINICGVAVADGVVVNIVVVAVRTGEEVIVEDMAGDLESESMVLLIDESFE
jgi:hypothetical protein